jgi:hypothetical protein
MDVPLDLRVAPVVGEAVDEVQSQAPVCVRLVVELRVFALALERIGPPPGTRSGSGQGGDGARHVRLV